MRDAWGLGYLGLEFTKKGFCLFLPDVPCSFVKSDKAVFMERCFSCSNYRRFEKEMQEEEDDFFKECDMIRKYGYPKSFHVSRGKRR
jgi:hypothetical protein